MSIEEYSLEFPELFDIKLDFSLGGINYDIHNDFVCERAKLFCGELQLIFRSETDVLIVHFRDAELKAFDLPFDKNFEYVLDNFHRGKIERDGTLYEEINGKKYYYLEFYEKGAIEILCSKIDVTHIALGAV